MKHPPRLLICGNYGATNLGDEAILKSILQFTKEAFPRAHVTVISANPEATARQFKVESVPPVPSGLRSFIRGLTGRTIRTTLNAYKECDAVIFGGGGLFTDEKPRAIFIWLMQILPALRRKKPIFCLGQSVGPLMMRTSRWTVHYIFRKMKIIVVRDEASRMVLNRMGISNVQVLPDPVFSFQNPAAAAGHRKPYIVFSLRQWQKNALQVHKTLAEFADWIHETYRLKIYFAPLQRLRDDDEAEIKQVLSRMKYRDAAEVLPYSENLNDLLKLVGEATAVVGMRLHSIIFSAVTGTPFLALSYSLKVAEVARQLGMGQFFCEYRFLDLDVLKKKFEKLYDGREHVEKLLHLKHQQFCAETAQYTELLKRFLSNIPGHD
jgi:polysaccharide pyruvyl transferase CsaB